VAPGSRLGAEKENLKPDMHNSRRGKISLGWAWPISSRRKYFPSALRPGEAGSMDGRTVVQGQYHVRGPGQQRRPVPFEVGIGRIDI